MVTQLKQNPVIEAFPGDNDDPQIVVGEVNPGTHYMAIMGEDGDTKIVWDPDKQDEVDNAKATYERLVKKGFLVYSVRTKGKKTGEKNHKLSDFDPDEEMLIFVPPIVGG